MKKLYLRTFGCQMNEYDSEKIADVLRAAEGLEAAARPEDADLIVFNTCSVREKAQEKVFADLGRVKHLKRARPGLMIAVGGCVASQEGAAIVARAPFVDVVFGPQTLHRLPELLERRRAHRRGAGRHQLSRDREVRPPAAGAAWRARAPSSRSWRAAASTAASASCRTPAARKCRGPFEDVLAEIAGLAAQRRQGSDAARPERQRLARHDRRRAGGLCRTAALTSLSSKASSASATRPRIRANSPSA